MKELLAQLELNDYYYVCIDGQWMHVDGLKWDEKHEVVLYAKGDGQGVIAPGAISALSTTMPRILGPL